MRSLAIVHERDAGPGVFAEAAALRGDDMAEWIPSDEPAPALDGIGAVLVFGGGMHVDQEFAHPWLAPEKQLLRELLARGTPMLGVCLGAQLLAQAAGGAARPAAAPEIGWTDVWRTPDAAHDPLLGHLPERFRTFQWHSYEACAPPGARPLAHSAGALQAFRLDRASVWGIQFHAEVTAEIVTGWLRDYGDDDDARRVGLDRDAVATQTSREIGRWNETGLGICRRFLDHAAARYSGVT